MEFSRHECWSRLPFLSDPGIEPEFPVSPALAGGFFTISAPWETPKPYWAYAVAEAIADAIAMRSLFFFFFQLFSLKKILKLKKIQRY